MTRNEDHKIQVLVIGGSVETRTIIARFLSETRDIQLIGSEENGLNGISRAKETLPDTVLVDASTHDMNSIELVKAIKSVTPTTKIIMMNRANDPEWMRAAIQAGTNTFLNKPIDESELSQAIYFLSQI
ncbi:MAG: response regulator transcription factor [Anaerolineae bacterium]|nr:response regulator transcription factor [Anaerolineae bacterium]